MIWITLCKGSWKSWLYYDRPCISYCEMVALLGTILPLGKCHQTVSACHTPAPPVPCICHTAFPCNFQYRGYIQIWRIAPCAKNGKASTKIYCQPTKHDWNKPWPSLKTPWRCTFLCGLTMPPLVAASKRISFTWILGGLFTGCTTKPELQLGQQECKGKWLQVSG